MEELTHSYRGLSIANVKVKGHWFPATFDGERWFRVREEFNQNKASNHSRHTGNNEWTVMEEVFPESISALGYIDEEDEDRMFEPWLDNYYEVGRNYPPTNVIVVAYDGKYKPAVFNNAWWSEVVSVSYDEDKLTYNSVTTGEDIEPTNWTWCEIDHGKNFCTIRAMPLRKHYANDPYIYFNLPHDNAPTT